MKLIDQSILLWSTIADIKSYDLEIMVNNKNLNEFKQEIGGRIGIGYRRFGCPFCHEYWADDCVECPIHLIEDSYFNRSCYETSYNDFEVSWNKKNIKGLKKSAKEFLDYLVKLKEMNNKEYQC